MSKIGPEPCKEVFNIEMKSKKQLDPLLDRLAGTRQQIISGWESATLDPRHIHDISSSRGRRNLACQM